VPRSRTSARQGARPTKWTALLLGAIALVSVLLPLPVIVPVLLAAILAGCVAVDLVVARRRHPTLERTRPPTLALRSPIAFDARAGAMESARSLRLRQPAPPALHVDPSEVPGAELAGELTGWHRGVHALGPVVLRSSGPLGLASVDLVAGEIQEVTVFPDLPRARRLAAARRRGRTTDEGRIRARLGLGTAFDPRLQP
jgi:uncharacterized protein (DUF58 family)